MSRYIEQINGLNQIVAQNKLDIENLLTQVKQNNELIGKLQKELDSTQQLSKSASLQIDALTADNNAKM